MNVKDKKGSITIFVLVGMLFMSSFLLISYGSILNKSKTVKEQYNIIKDIYSNHDSDAEAYNTVYATLRNENKKTLTASMLNSKTLVLTQIFDGTLTNYRIYGTMGSYITIKVASENDNNSKEYTINLLSSLESTEYIDYKTQSVRYANGTIKEMVSLPTIATYEDYTKIEITNGGTPSKIIVDYVGYEFNS